MAAAIAAGTLGVLAPSAGAVSAGTNVTFTLGGGALNISAPVSADLGSVQSGAVTTVAGNIGATSVTDNRGSLPGTIVNVNIATTSFIYNDSANHQIASPTASEQIANTAALYTAPATPTSSSPATALYVATAQSGAGAGTPAVVLTEVAGGNSSATWNPSLSLTWAGQQLVAGVYSGTLTQSAT